MARRDQPMAAAYSQRLPASDHLFWRALSEDGNRPALMFEASRPAMLKDILLNMDVDADPHATTNFAISVAHMFDAHVSGIAFAYDVLPPYEPTAAELVNAGRERSEAAAQHAISHVEEAARGSGVLVESHIIRASFANAPDIFTRFARTADISIVTQSQP